MLLKDTGNCYVCGPDNPSGLRVEFTFDAASRTVRGRFTPRPEHAGWEGIVHGGVVAALLDESMVKLAALLGMPSMSVELCVRFRRPAVPGDELIVTAAVTRESRRLVAAGSAVRRGPVVIADATGKLLVRK